MNVHKSKGVFLGVLTAFCVFLLLWGVYHFYPQRIECVRSFFPLLNPLAVKMDRAAEELKCGKTIEEAVEAFFYWGSELHETNSR